MSASLTKSYFPSYDLDKPVRKDLILGKVFDEVKKEKRESLFVNMDTGERVTNLSILDKGEKYSRGLLTLGLEPGVDNIAVIGCATFEALAIFVAAAELGYGFSPHFFPSSKATRLVTEFSVVSPKVIITGEGTGGHNFNALVDLFDSEDTKPNSKELPFVERIFYDSSYKDRSPSHKFIQTLDELIKLGEKVSDEQLLQAKLKVKPEFDLQYCFTTGSTGTSKCFTHAQRARAYDATRIIFSNEPTLLLNIGVDVSIGYAFALGCLVGRIKKGVMISERYGDKLPENFGETLTQAIIDESIGQLQLILGPLRAIIDYLKVSDVRLPKPLAVFYTGQIMSPTMMEENMKLMPGVHYTVYGMTEVGYIATNLSLEGDCFVNKRGLYPVPETELRLVNEEVVDIGEPGEIQLKSPTILKEYRNNTELTRKAFTADGFFKTGDQAIMYEDGSIKLLGRMSYHERFNVFCEVEYAAPLEAIINKHAHIIEAYVVSGKLNDWLGDELTFCIRMDSVEAKIHEQEFLDFWEAKGMYERQRPARVLYFESFPMTDNGRKVSRQKLTAQVQAMVAEDEEIGKCEWFAKMERSGRS